MIIVHSSQKNRHCIWNQNLHAISDNTHFVKPTIGLQTHNWKLFMKDDRCLVEELLIQSFKGLVLIVQPSWPINHGSVSFSHVFLIWPIVSHLYSGEAEIPTRTLSLRHSILILKFERLSLILRETFDFLSKFTRNRHLSMFLWLIRRLTNKRKTSKNRCWHSTQLHIYEIKLKEKNILVKCRKRCNLMK